MEPGEIIKELRIERGYTQRELGKKCGLSQVEISAIEGQRIRLGLVRAGKIARALGVHPSLILFPDLYLKEKKK